MLSRFLIFAAACLLWTGLALAQLNINTASPNQLDSLKGIGPARAKAIVDYRKKNGPFRSVDDLQNVPGIGAKTLDALRPKVTVGGASLSPAAPRREVAAESAPSRPAVPAAKAASADKRPAMPRSSDVRSEPPTAPARPAMPANRPHEAHPASSAPLTQDLAPAVPLAKPTAPARPAMPAQVPASH